MECNILKSFMKKVRYILFLDTKLKLDCKMENAYFVCCTTVLKATPYCLLPLIQGRG